MFVSGKMIIKSKFAMNKLLLGLLLCILMIGCAQVNQYTLEDVEEQRLKFNNGEEKALKLLTEIYKDQNQVYDVRLAAIRILSESQNPEVIREIQTSIRKTSFIEMELMKEALRFLVVFQDIVSTDTLIADLTATEEKSMEIRKSIIEAIGNNTSSDAVTLLIRFYDINKRSNVNMNKLLANTLGGMGDDKVIPILMEIAKNKTLPIDVRNRSVELLSKKQAPELVDFFVELLGDPITRNKVNEFAFDVMGELSDERMIFALVEAYQVGRHKYYALLNTIINNLDDYENPKIKGVYLDIAQTKDLPSNIRLKAFKGLTRFSDPEIIEGVIDLLNDPENYVYYNEIVGMLHNYDMYDNYQKKLRIAAYIAMQKEIGLVKKDNE